MDSLVKNVSDIQGKLGYQFKNPLLLVLAFVHRSFINENKEIKEHNERLEFLGDSVLGLLVAEYLYRFFPSTDEGVLSSLRSRLVEASSCVEYVQALDIGKHVLLGKGERMNDGRGRESILADLFEAIIGAIYLDGGIEEARNFLFNNFANQIDAILKKPTENWKAALQDYCQKNFQKTPKYKLVSESGPDHSKIFVMSVLIDEKVLGQGEGPSKKEAQQAAAGNAFSKFCPK